MASSMPAHASPTDVGDVLPAEVWAEVFVRLDRREDRVNMLRSRKAWLECPVILSHIQRLVVDEENADLTTFQPGLATIQRLHIVTMDFPKALFYHRRLSNVTEVCMEGYISYEDLDALTRALPGLRKLEFGMNVTGERCVQPLSRLTKLEDLTLSDLMFDSDGEQAFVREMNRVLACTPVLSLKMNGLCWMSEELRSPTVRHIVCEETSVIYLENADLLAPSFPMLQRVSVGGIFLFNSIIDPEDTDEWIEDIERFSGVGEPPVSREEARRVRPRCWDIIRLCPEFKLWSMKNLSDDEYVIIQRYGKRFGHACTRVLDDIMLDDRISTQAASVVTCLDLEAMYLTHETVDVLARCFVSVRRLRLRNQCHFEDPTVLGRLIMEMPALSALEAQKLEGDDARNDKSAAEACVSLAVMTCRNQGRSVHVTMP